MSARLANVVFTRTTGGGKAPGRGTNRDLSISLSLAVIFSSFFFPPRLGARVHALLRAFFSDENVMSEVEIAGRGPTR